jgi:hypothetical protein
MNGINRLWRKYRVWKAKKFYGIDLVFVSPEEHARIVPQEGRGDTADDGPEVSIIRTEMEIQCGEKLYWRDPGTNKVLFQPKTLDELMEPPYVI